jgi:hypothetical protein
MINVRGKQAHKEYGEVYDEKMLGYWLIGPAYARRIRNTYV